MVYCDHCSPEEPIPVAESELPIMLPEQIDITQTNGSPLGRVAEFVNAKVSEVWWSGAARDGHDGYVRRFELVLLPVYGCEELEGSF